MKLYATSALGGADLVAAELRALGFAGVRHDAGGASFGALTVTLARFELGRRRAHKGGL